MPELYVDGAWTSAAAGGRREIRCPADGSLVAEVDEAGAEDTDAAIAAAHRAFHDGEWPTTSGRERGDLLLRLADLLERDADEVARVLHPHIEGHGAWLGRPPHEVFTVSGPAPQAAERLRALATAGADTVVLRIAGPDPLRQLEAVLDAVGRRN